MVNPVKFDRSKVVEKASQLFWRKGFNATSTRDIQQAVDMRPGSIYATFGSKQGLYVEAIRSYVSSMEQQMSSCLDESGSVLDGLEYFVHKILIEERDEQACEVCMLVKANAEFTNDAPELKALSQSLLADFEQHLSKVFSKAQAEGELPKHLKPIDYARNFQIHFTGLRSYIKRSNDNALTETLIKQMFNMIKQL